MTSEEKMRALEALQELEEYTYESYGAELTIGYQMPELIKAIRAALHSVEAGRQPDAYMDSWEYRDFKRTGVGTVFNTHEHMGKAIPFYLQAVCNQAEKEPEWISCEERLPTEKDGDCDLCVWAFNPRRGVASKIKPDSVEGVNFTHWMPTGLKRPEPPVE